MENKNSLKENIVTERYIENVSDMSKVFGAETDNRSQILGAETTDKSQISSAKTSRDRSQMFGAETSKDRSQVFGAEIIPYQVVASVPYEAETVPYQSVPEPVSKTKSSQVNR